MTIVMTRKTTRGEDPYRGGNYLYSQFFTCFRSVSVQSRSARQFLDKFKTVIISTLFLVFLQITCSVVRLGTRMNINLMNSFGKKYDGPMDRPKILLRKRCKLEHLLLLALAVCLGGIVALVYNKILGPVVMAAREVLVQDLFDTIGVALYCVSRWTRLGRRDTRLTFCASIEVPDMWGTMALPPPHGFCA